MATKHLSWKICWNNDHKWWWSGHRSGISYVLLFSFLFFNSISSLLSSSICTAKSSNNTVWLG